MKRNSTRRSEVAPPRAVDIKAQVDAFIDKFEPSAAALIRRCRTRLRKVFPSAVEVVYDNYNFFVIGYSPSGRPSDTIVSLAAAANGVGLSFYRGATIADPHGLLLGTGTQNRFIRLPTAEILEDANVEALIAAAIAQSKVPLRPGKRGSTVVKSISGKQRPRRKARDAA
jgi:hypothetical protein